MFGKSIRIFKLFGFEVKIDLSWIILALLIVWTLADGVFPKYYPHLTKPTYWWMGVAGALGLFLSIVFHEMSHSLVARHYGLPMKGITLFIFGGVAEMNEEPQNAKTEFLMAIAGPIASVVIGFVFYGIARLLELFAPVSLSGTFEYLFLINLVLAGFNMLPAFPLDGGRVLRAIIWRIKNDLRKATDLASQIGLGFGTAFIILGIFGVLMGNFISGFWWVLIGLFLRNASSASYRRLIIKEIFEGEKVERFMNPEPISVNRATPLSEVVEDFVYKHHYKLYPIVENGRLLGCLTTDQIKHIPREEWPNRTAGEVSDHCTTENTVGPQEDVMSALNTMSRYGLGRLMVVSEDRLLGVVALKDLLAFLSMKMELEPHHK